MPHINPPLVAQRNPNDPYNNMGHKRKHKRNKIEKYTRPKPPKGKNDKKYLVL